MGAATAFCLAALLLVARPSATLQAQDQHDEDGTALQLTSPRPRPALLAADGLLVSAQLGSTQQPVCASTSVESANAPVCYEDGGGPFGGAGRFAVLATGPSVAAAVSAGFRHGTAAPVGLVPRTACPAAADNTTQLFDVTVYDGEALMLAVRIAELLGIPNVVHIVVEAAVTHAGAGRAPVLAAQLAGELAWAAHRVLPVVLSAADLERCGSLGKTGAAASGARERCQRDVGTAAGLRAARAQPDDVVVVADVDEVVSADTAAALVRCAGAGLLPAPVALLMDWRVYSFRWRAALPWGLVAREGAVVVRARMVADHDALPRGWDAAAPGDGSEGAPCAPATTWRRQLRPAQLGALGGSSFAVWEAAGWHLSSFGGPARVAAKLSRCHQSALYGTDFFFDEARLRRLARLGVPYYHLSGPAGVSAADVAVSPALRLARVDVGAEPLPRAARASGPGGPLGVFYGLDGDGDGDDDDADVAELAYDVAGARYEKLLAADRKGSPYWPQDPALPGSEAAAGPPPLPLHVACAPPERRAADTAAFCALHDVGAGNCAKVAVTAADKCSEAGSAAVEFPVHFNDRVYLPVQVDGARRVVEMGAGGDPERVAAQACAHFGIQGPHCPAVAAALRGLLGG